MDCMQQNRCPSNSAGPLEQNYPVGMGYVPWQIWNQIYPLNQALNRGTLFPELDLPFDFGRCRRL